jgi:hypothetical protein
MYGRMERLSSRYSRLAPRPARNVPDPYNSGSGSYVFSLAFKIGTLPKKFKFLFLFFYFFFSFLTLIYLLFLPLQETSFFITRYLKKE